MSNSDNINYTFTTFLIGSSVILALNSFCIIPHNHVGYYRYFSEYNKQLLKSEFYFKWFWTKIKTLKINNELELYINFNTIDNVSIKNFNINLYFDLDENNFSNIINEDIDNIYKHYKLRDLIKFNCLNILKNYSFNKLNVNPDEVIDNLRSKLDKILGGEYGIKFTYVTYYFENN